MSTITPSKRNLKLYEGTTKDISWKLKDLYGNSINITDWTAIAQIKDELDGTLILTITTEDDAIPANIVIAGELGKITLHFETVLETYQGVYDMFLIDATGYKHKLVLPSTITVYPSITTIPE